MEAAFSHVTHDALGIQEIVRLLQMIDFDFKRKASFSTNMSEALELFLCREKRKVDNEFCDVRIDKRFFAVDVKYRGDQVLVSYDPISNLDEVRLYSLEEQFLQVASRYERERGTHPFASAANETATSETPLDHEYLKLLEARHQAQLRKQAQHGIDYHRAQTTHPPTALSHQDRFGGPFSCANLPTSCHSA